MSLPLPSQEEDVGQGCAGDLRESGLGCRGLFWDPGSCGWALPSLLMLQLIWRCWAEPGRVVKLNWGVLGASCWLRLSLSHGTGVTWRGGTCAARSLRWCGGAQLPPALALPFPCLSSLPGTPG